MSKQAYKTYQVAVSRPVIRTVIIEVDAESDEQAAEMALDKATQLSEQAWSGEFEPESYGYDIVDVVPKDDILEQQEEDESYLAQRIDAVRYLLLRADADAGEGALLFQPWLQFAPPLVIADICQDWLEDMQLLADEGVDGVMEWLDELAVDATPIPPEVIARLPWIWQQRKKTDD